MSSQMPTVLIVDDEPSDLEQIKRDLAPLGVRLVALQDGKQLLETVAAEGPDLVLLDALLPGVSGFDLCRNVKEISAGKDCPVVILTGIYLKERYRQDATSRYKADAFMTKPYQRLELQRLSLKLLAERLKTTPAELRSRLGKAKEADHEIDRHAQLEAERASSSPEGTKAKAGEAVRVKGRQQKIADAAMNTMRARAIFEDISKHLGERQVGEELSSSSADPGSETIMASPGKPHAEPVEQAFVSPSTFRRGDARKENLRIYSEELFFTELNLDMSRCRRSGQPLSLVLVRVGDLPEILQLFGAAFRDQVLNYVAERAVASMRDVDMAGLLGDEASVAIAAFAADRDGVDRILARIHRSMRHYPLSAGEGVPAVVPSLRVGAAVYPREAQDLDGLVTRARNELTV